SPGFWLPGFTRPVTAPLPSNFSSSPPEPLSRFQVPETGSAAAPPDCAAIETTDNRAMQTSHRLFSFIELSPLLVIASERGLIALSLARTASLKAEEQALFLDVL